MDRSFAIGLMAAGLVLLCVAVGLVWWIVTDPEPHKGVHSGPLPVGKHRLDTPAAPGLETKRIMRRMNARQEN